MKWSSHLSSSMHARIDIVLVWGRSSIGFLRGLVSDVIANTTTAVAKEVRLSPSEICSARAQTSVRGDAPRRRGRRVERARMRLGRCVEVCNKDVNVRVPAWPDRRRRRQKPRPPGRRIEHGLRNFGRERSYFWAGTVGSMTWQRVLCRNAVELVLSKNQGLPFAVGTSFNLVTKHGDFGATSLFNIHHTQNQELQGGTLPKPRGRRQIRLLRKQRALHSFLSIQSLGTLKAVRW